MRTRRVAFDEGALSDLDAIYDWVADAASERVALDYIDRLVAFCKRLDMAAERGRSAGHIRPGLRVLGFERRVNVAFVVEEDEVVILRVLSGRRDWEGLLSD